MTRLFEDITPSEWREFRQSYRYPAVRLIAADGQTAVGMNPHVAWGNMCVVPDEARADHATDEEIENYHRDLLLSECPDKRTIGAISVIYWGNYAGSDGKKTGFSLARAKHFIHGRKRKSRETGEVVFHNSQLAIDKIHDVTAKAREAILGQDVGAALKSFASLVNVGPSFASKMVAFCLPERAGVMDAVIARNLATRLPESVFPEIQLQIQRAYFPRGLADNYRIWCEMCQSQAEKLNSVGEFWHTNDCSTKAWRAIDIERAIFAWSAGTPRHSEATR